jgi:hypothetical protein
MVLVSFTTAIDDTAAIEETDLMLSTPFPGIPFKRD